MGGLGRGRVLAGRTGPGFTWATTIGNVKIRFSPQNGEFRFPLGSTDAKGAMGDLIRKCSDDHSGRCRPSFLRVQPERRFHQAAPRVQAEPAKQ
jgi:hypothetical protein